MSYYEKRENRDIAQVMLDRLWYFPKSCQVCLNFIYRQNIKMIVFNLGRETICYQNEQNWALISSFHQNFEKIGRKKRNTKTLPDLVFSYFSRVQSRVSHPGEGLHSCLYWFGYCLFVILFVCLFVYLFVCYEFLFVCNLVCFFVCFSSR